MVLAMVLAMFCKRGAMVLAMVLAMVCKRGAMEVAMVLAMFCKRGAMVLAMVFAMVFESGLESTRKSWSFGDSGSVSQERSLKSLCAEIAIK